MTQLSGFDTLNGTGTGFLEGLLDVGQIERNVPDGWLTPCPVGSRVDGYQVVKEALIFQIRPRCSCVDCGMRALFPLYAAALTLPELLRMHITFFFPHRIYRAKRHGRFWRAWHAIVGGLPWHEMVKPYKH